MSDARKTRCRIRPFGVPWRSLGLRLLSFSRPDDLCVVVFVLTVSILFASQGLPFVWTAYQPLLPLIKYFLFLLFPLFVIFLTDDRYDILKTFGRLGKGALAFSRDFLPYLVCMVIYFNLADVVHLVNPTDRDAWLIRIDQAILGVQLSQWMQPLSHVYFDEWMHFTYEIFGLYPISLALFLLARGERRAFRDVFLAIILGHYIGYLGYMLVPAIGPRYTLEFDVDLLGRFFASVDWAMSDTLRIPRDCFPSLHTSDTVVTLALTWRYRRGLLWIYLPLGLSTIVATVYLRYHYVIDVVAGATMALAVSWIAPRWNDWWDAWTARLREVSRGS